MTRSTASTRIRYSDPEVPDGGSVGTSYTSEVVATPGCTHVPPGPKLAGKPPPVGAEVQLSPPLSEYSSNTSTEQIRMSSDIDHATNSGFAGTSGSESDSSQYSPPFGETTLTNGWDSSSTVNVAGSEN